MKNMIFTRSKNGYLYYTMEKIYQKTSKFFFQICVFCSITTYGQQNTGIPVIQVSKSSEKAELRLSDICSDISYTKLEFNDKYPVARPFALHVTSEYIFFLSRTGILKYTRDGKKVEMIGSIGQGPGEYLGGSSFVVDEKSGKMYIQANFTKDILVYDYAKNKYLYKFKLPFNYPAYIRMANEDVISMFGGTIDRYTSRYFSLKLIDSKDGKILYEKTNPDFIKPKSEHRWQNLGIIGGASFLWKDDINSYCSIHEMGSDTIFSISKEWKVAPRFILNCPNRIHGENLVEFYAGTSNYLFWWINDETLKKCFYGFYDKMLKKSFIYSQNDYNILNDEKKKIMIGIENDIDGGLPIKIPYSSNSFSHWHIFVEPFDLIEYVNSPEFKKAVVKDPKKKEELVRFVKTLEDDDNPVLVTLTLK